MNEVSQELVSSSMMTQLVLKPLQERWVASWQDQLFLIHQQNVRSSHLSLLKDLESLKGLKDLYRY